MKLLPSASTRRPPVTLCFWVKLVVTSPLGDPEFWRLATRNVWSLYRSGGFRITISELRKYKIAIAAIKDTRWNKLTLQAFTSNGYNIYTRSLANNHEFGTAFLVDSKFNHMVINFTPIFQLLSHQHTCVNKWVGRGGQGSILWTAGEGIRSLLKSWREVGDGRSERKSWPRNRTSANDRQAQPPWEYKWKWP
jgi:hypothetical protein